MQGAKRLHTATCVWCALAALSNAAAITPHSASQWLFKCIIWHTRSTQRTVLCYAVVYLGSFSPNTVCVCVCQALQWKCNKQSNKVESRPKSIINHGHLLYTIAYTHFLSFSSILSCRLFVVSWWQKRSTENVQKEGSLLLLKVLGCFKEEVFFSLFIPSPPHSCGPSNWLVWYQGLPPPLLYPLTLSPVYAVYRCHHHAAETNPKCVRQQPFPCSVLKFPRFQSDNFYFYHTIRVA